MDESMNLLTLSTVVAETRHRILDFQSTSSAETGFTESESHLRSNLAVTSGELMKTSQGNVYDHS